MGHRVWESSEWGPSGPLAWLTDSRAFSSVAFGQAGAGPAADLVSGGVHFRLLVPRAELLHAAVCSDPSE